MRYAETTIVERMIGASIAATRCRQAAREPEVTQRDLVALMRAADRYSGLIAELADEMLDERGEA